MEYTFFSSIAKKSLRITSHLILFFGASVVGICVGVVGVFTVIVPAANALAVASTTRNMRPPRRLFFINKNEKICIPIKYTDIQ